MIDESGRQIVWYSIIYFSGDGKPSFHSPEATPYFEGGREARFDTFEEAVHAVERTPMYLRDRKKAARKFRIVKTNGEIVFNTPLGAIKKFVKSRDTYLQWFEIMLFDDARSFNAPFQGVRLGNGQPASYGKFSAAFDALVELMGIWSVPEQFRENYNIVLFQSELLHR